MFIFISGPWFSSGGELSAARSSFLHQSAESLRSRRPTERPPPPPRPTAAAPPPPICAPPPPGLSPGRVPQPVELSLSVGSTPPLVPVLPIVPPPPPAAVPPPPPLRTTSAQQQHPSPTSGRTCPPPLPNSLPPPLPPSRHSTARHSQLTSKSYDSHFIYCIVYFY